MRNVISVQKSKMFAICFVVLFAFATALFAAPPDGKGGGGKGGGKTSIGGITISAPATASAGEVITVKVEPIGDARVDQVVVFDDKGGGVGSSNTVPYTDNYVIPLDVVGALTLSAFAVDAASEVSYDASTVVQVDTGSATLQSMELRLETEFDGSSSQKMYFSYFRQQAAPYIVGTYSDGVDRDLSSPANGTVYTSQNTGVIQILPEGVLQAVGEGATTVTVTNSDISHTLQATVDFVDPEQGTVCGARCTDRDLALTYSPPVTLIPEMEVPSNLLTSTTITLPANATRMTFAFHNNSGLPQLGIARGVATWQLDKRSDPNCAVSFANNLLPTDIPPYAVQRGEMTVILPSGGGTCIFTTNIEGLPDKDADKWTIYNPPAVT